MGVRVVQNMTLLAFSQNISNILFDYGLGNGQKSHKHLKNRGNRCSLIHTHHLNTQIITSLARKNEENVCGTEFR